MRTNIALDLTDEQRQALHVLITGKPGSATRKQITEWALETLTKRIAKPNGEKSELRNFVCPKCQKPVALSVPIGAAKPKLDAVAKATVKTNAAIETLIANLGGLTVSLTELGGAK